MQVFCILFFCFLSLAGFAQQKQGAWWMIGGQTSIDFNKKGPFVERKEHTGCGTCAATVSDASGNLLFFGEGGYLYTRSYTISPATGEKIYRRMPHGTPYNGWCNFSNMIVQSPADPQVYYFFFFRSSTLVNPDTTYIYCQEVDMRLNNGLGDVVTGSKRLLQKGVANNITVLQHANNRDYWILNFNKTGDSTFARLLSPAGLSAPVKSFTGPTIPNVKDPRFARGLKSAPNSQLFAAADSSKISLFDFDQATGQPAFRFSLQLPATALNQEPNSVAFSPDNSKLYVGTKFDFKVSSASVNISLFQYNLLAGNAAAVQQSCTLIYSFILNGSNPLSISDMQLGIDGKLYVQAGGGSTDRYLSRVECPNALGTACGFRYHKIDLNGKSAGNSLPSLNQTLFRNANNLQAQALRDSICLGDSVQLSAYGAGTERFRWQPANGLTVPADTLANPMVKPTVTTTYMVIGSSLCHTDTAYVKVTVLPKPGGITLSGPASICPQLQGVWYKASNPQQQKLSWGIKGGTITTLAKDSISVNWGNANAAAKIWAVPINILGCPGDTVFLPVRINVILATEKPKGADTLCLASASNISYQITKTAGSVYSWGIKGGTILNGQGTAVVKVTWANAGIGKIWVKEESQTSTSHCFGISDTLRTTVFSSPDTTLSIAGPKQVCARAVGQTYSYNGASSSSYFWNVTGGQIIAGQGSNAVTINWGAAGVGTIEVTETNQAGCIGTKQTATVQVQALPQPTIKPGSDLAICPGIAGKSLLYQVQGLPGSAFKWLIQNGQLTSGQGTGSVTINWLPGNGLKKLAVIETSVSGCVSDTLYFPFIIDNAELLLESVSVSEDNKTIHGKFIARNASNYPASTLDLQIQQKENLNQSSVKVNISPGDFTVPNLQPGENNYGFWLSGINLCGDSIYSNKHRAILLQSGNQQSGETVKLNWNNYEGWGSESVTCQLWRKLEAEKTYKLLSTLPENTNNYTRDIASDGFLQCFRVKAATATGKISWSNSICLEFENSPKFYNVITPNGDKLNEEFIIENLHLYPENELNIYNRWGQNIFNSVNYQNNWNGENVSAGTYYYLFTSRGKKWKGWLEIVK
jgi:gliding motility-associated-like protein